MHDIRLHGSCLLSRMLSLLLALHMLNLLLLMRRLLLGG